MPLLGLTVSAILRNVARLSPADNHNMIYSLQLHCEQCGWESPDPHEVRLCDRAAEASYGSRRRGPVNYAVKCPECNRKGEIRLVAGSETPLTAQNSKDVVIMVLDCEGILPLRYFTNGGWKLTTVGGTEQIVNIKNERFEDDEQDLEIRFTSSSFNRCRV